MLAAEIHRGPDDDGLQSFGDDTRGCALGSRRLAIIDLSVNGHMPMVDEESGNAIVYNGEVYNYRELRAELIAAGERFRSDSDTEVVLKAYRRWGRACLDRFRGMFAFALWDAGANEIFMARDRAGKKPLYYTAAAGGLLFASEVRALLASGLVERRADPVALQSYLFNGFICAPHSLVEGVRSLLPAHWMRVSGTGEIVEVGRYWRFPSSAVDDANATDAIEAARAAFLDSVRLRLRSDVPLGAFLSGGLDSSAIIAGMTRHAVDVRTFSVGFAEENFDESDQAESVARFFGTTHTTVSLGIDEFRDGLGDGLAAMDQPTFDGLNTFFVARAAKRSGLTVALSGLGADEMFGGYDFFRQGRWLAVLAAVIRKEGRAGLRHMLERKMPLWLAGAAKPVMLLTESAPESRGGQVLAAYQTAQALFPPWTEDFLWGYDIGPDALGFGLPADTLAYLAGEEDGGDVPIAADMSHLAFRLFLGERCLRDTDSMSMGSSLEVRAPFTDHILIEALARIPAARRCSGAPNKPVEWAMMAPILRGGLARRRKQGFTLPIQEWLQKAAITREIEEVLGDTTLVRALGFRPEAVARLAARSADRPAAVPWSRPWALFVLFRWCARHGVTL